MKLTALKNTVAIDLGTDFTRIYYKGEITVFPSVIAYDSQDGTIIAAGDETLSMEGKNPALITVSKPLTKGVITDFDLAAQMIHIFLESILGNVLRPRVFITVPCGVTDVEKRALCDILRESEISDICVIESPIAGAIGANCDVSLARGMLLVDIGGGKCDIAAISVGQAIIGRSVKIGGDDFTDAVIDYILEKHSLSCGRQSAEKLKKSIGCAFMRERNDIDEISGFNTYLKKPEKIAVRSEELREAFSPLISQIAAEIKATLDEIPTELLGDILDDGILLIGGGAQLYGMAKRLRAELNIKVFLAEDAEMCVIKGAGYVADNADKMSDNTYIFAKA
ncbi:MAG: rod shape-determining protein [Clostridia bacterium]|nr:rod shape-determining protein [Clostridia bacterium]